MKLKGENMKGIERIKILSSEIKDKALLKIVEYLLERKDMDDKYLNEEKNLTQMVNFIKSLAVKQSKNGMAIIEDEVVYSWAIHYWDETNKNLNINSSKNEEKKEIATGALKKMKEWVPEGQLTLF